MAWMVNMSAKILLFAEWIQSKAEMFRNPTQITCLACIFEAELRDWRCKRAVSSCCWSLSFATVCPAVWRSEDGAAGAAGDVWQQSEGESRAGGGAAALQGRAGETVRGGSGERPPTSSKHTRKGASLSDSWQQSKDIYQSGEHAAVP